MREKNNLKTASVLPGIDSTSLGTLLEGRTSFGVFMMAVTTKAMASNHSVTPLPLWIIVKETALLTIEMIHHQIKVITQRTEPNYPSKMPPPPPHMALSSQQELYVDPLVCRLYVSTA